MKQFFRSLLLSLLYSAALTFLLNFVIRPLFKKLKRVIYLRRHPKEAEYLRRLSDPDFRDAIREVNREFPKIKGLSKPKVRMPVLLLPLILLVSITGFWNPFAHVHLQWFSGNTWYVDPAAGGLNNGTSWTNAWTSLSLSGVAAGDTVYISGGAQGNTQTYNLAGAFNSITGFCSGTVGSWVTYKIGQDSAHNGTAIFNWTSGYSEFLNAVGSFSYFIVSGDAGDGAMHFQTSNYALGINWASLVGVRASYINFGSIPKIGISNPCTGLEVDHCYAYCTNLTTADYCFYAQCTGSAYDVNLFHDNTFYVPYNSALDGTGMDAWKLNGNGWSMYNNLIIGYSASFTEGEHQDGVQSNAPASYVKIYNNLFINMQNYDIYFGQPLGNIAHLWVYNNIGINTVGSGTQSIAIAGYTDSPGPYTVTDCIIANNLGDGFYNTFTLRDPNHGTTSGIFVTCYAYNNTAVNPSNSNIFDPAVTAANNVTVTAAQAPSDFVTWILNSISNNYHLKAGASALIGTGTNCSAWFSIDKDNNSRAAPWDIGPYKYIASGSGLIMVRK